MRILRVVAGAAAALALGAAAARAQPLTVVEVNAPAVNCVFHPACTITVSDSVQPSCVSGPMLSFWLRMGYSATGASS